MSWETVSTFSGKLSVGGDNGFNVLSNGYVGIGVATPTVPLEINSVIGTELLFSGSAPANIYSTTGQDFAIRTTDAKSLRLGTNDTDRIYVTSGGNVGIGSTFDSQPSEKLDVVGIALIQNYLKTSYVVATSTATSSQP